MLIFHKKFVIMLHNGGESMIKIAVCDDGNNWLNEAVKIINSYLCAKCEDFGIDRFESSDCLLNAIFDKKRIPDILMLDIEMPGINGFEIAEKIRKIYPELILIFCTAHEQFVYDSFRFQPFRYIRKEYANQEIPTALSAALQVLEKRFDKSILLKTADGIRLIAINDIIYYETEKRRCNVYLCDESVLNVRKTIKELTEEIDSDYFVKIHSGAVVNAKYIKSYSGYDLTLDNDTRLIVSRGHIKDVKSAVLKYIGGNV